jgi:hypothetical protein
LKNQPLSQALTERERGWSYPWKNQDGYNRTDERKNQMEYEKADDISFVDLKEVCEIFNQHAHLLGARINTRRKGFDALMPAFVKAVTAIPPARWEEIPEEVMEFYRALPSECIDAAHVSPSVPVGKVVGADDGIPQFELPAPGIPDGLKYGDRADAEPLPLRKKMKPRLVPLSEGKMKIRRTSSLMEAVRYLEDLVAALKGGQLFIVSKNRMIMMKPDDSVRIKLEAGIQEDKKSCQEQMSIGMEWKRGSDMGRHGGETSISGKEAASR